MLGELEGRKDAMGSSLCFFFVFMEVYKGKFVFVATFRYEFVSFVKERSRVFMGGDV